jgi:signal recognition particle subunit SRP54
MGDVVSLVERAQEQFDEEEARRIQKNRQNEFGFDDFHPNSTGEKWVI